MSGLTAVPLPILDGGEDSGAAPLATGLAQRVENGLYRGAGVIEHVPDWRLAATCTDGGTENDAVCGIFPFATQGTASGPSAGIAFSFDTSANKIWLHQLGEDGSILRTLQAWTGYTESAPPQITGFEMFGKFYANAYGREAAASRLGMGVYDPAANTFTVPTYDLSAGGAAAAALRFRWISKHRGGLILGGCYLNEEAGNIDQPQTVRYCKYGAPDTWVADTSATSASFFNTGTLNLPVVAAAASGQYTILGKETEVFALDGDYSAQLSYRQIGQAHGPCSTAGMVTTGPLAVWITRDGYLAASENGGAVQLIGPDRLARRRLTYYDLTYACGVHHASESSVGFLMRRSRELNGTALTASWPDQILWWDYARDAFRVQGTPTTCFSIGTIAGPGTALAGPSGTPSSLAASPTSSSASLTWSNATGDPSAATIVEYRVNGAASFTVAGTTAAGATSWSLAGLTASTVYNWRLRYIKNGQYSAYVNGSNFTTSAASSVGQPTGLANVFSSTSTYGGKTYATYLISWTRTEFSSGSQTRVSIGTTATFAAAATLSTFASSTVSVSETQLVSSPLVVRYYWVQHVLADGTVSTETGPTVVTFETA